MHARFVTIRNFRRLKNVTIDLAKDISIFVGANNSGKTAAAEAIRLFASGRREQFSLYDFNSSCWQAIRDFGERRQGIDLPKLSLDLWFEVDASDLHRVIDLLPSLDWSGTLVGVRVEFSASDPSALLERYQAAKARAVAARPEGEDYHPPPRHLYEYLESQLSREFELRYFVLDRSRFDPDLNEAEGYQPQQILTEQGRSGRNIVGSLVRVDLLRAQRHLSDSADAGRAEDLSRRLSRFYARNLQKRGDDISALKALALSEENLNEHLASVFEPTLRKLEQLGYPGLSNPRLLIKSALRPDAIMNSSEGTRVHYAIGTGDEDGNHETLPDRYNGLGFKNLIYMVVELLDLHAMWVDEETARPPLHLIFIEEPEAHLHAQLQQVFIRKVLDILSVESESEDRYTSQVVVTTHSPHVLYERGFRPIRYFRRNLGSAFQESDVLNLSAFYEQTEHPIRDFLERYLRLTHCDLFFADAAVLVEGNVERILLPQMIAKNAPRLQSTYLSILEIGGAFGFRFRTLVEFLGITALVITDLDSIDPGAHRAACRADTVGAETSNQTLVKWLPALSKIADLKAASEDLCTQSRVQPSDALARVTYQRPGEIHWKQQTASATARTLEEAFALENLEFVQSLPQADLQLIVAGADTLSPAELAERIFDRVTSPTFNKTDFALALLSADPAAWKTPAYIEAGLVWLQGQLVPEEV